VAKHADQDRKPPPPEAWQSAPVLVPVASAAEPALVSDGGGLPFPPDRPFEPADTLRIDDPAVKALIAQIDRGRRQALPERPFRPKPKPAPMPTSEKLAGWRALARTDTEVLFGRGRPPHLLTVAARSARRGRWKAVGVSNSRPLRACRDGIRASSWRLDPDFEPDPNQTDLRILVTEVTMASGALAADRLLEPELHLDSERVLLRVYVKPLVGYVGRAARHETPVIVRLPEPLGARRAVDGALFQPPL
jgi:hypothetical protein